MPSKNSTKSGKTSVLKNAAFLMAATLICRVIGLLYRSPLHNIIGNLGDGYYSYAFEWYNIILLLSSYSIPMAVSKVMAESIYGAPKYARSAPAPPTIRTYIRDVLNIL